MNKCFKDYPLSTNPLPEHQPYCFLHVLGNMFCILMYIHYPVRIIFGLCLVQYGHNGIR